MTCTLRKLEYRQKMSGISKNTHRKLSGRRKYDKIG